MPVAETLVSVDLFSAFANLFSGPFAVLTLMIRALTLALAPEPLQRVLAAKNRRRLQPCRFFRRVGVATG